MSEGSGYMAFSYHWKDSTKRLCMSVTTEKLVSYFDDDIWEIFTRRELGSW